MKIVSVIWLVAFIWYVWLGKVTINGVIKDNIIEKVWPSMMASSIIAAILGIPLWALYEILF